jgi:hypothetical protein
VAGRQGDHSRDQDKNIFLFLSGAVLAWAFRVWILVPAAFVMAIVCSALGFGRWSFGEICGYPLLLAVVPQLGYAFGLLAHNAMLVVRLRSASSREASVATLYQQRAADKVR